MKLKELEVSDIVNKKIPISLKELIELRIDGEKLAYQCLISLANLQFPNYLKPLNNEFPLFFYQFDLNSFYLASFGNIDFSFLQYIKEFTDGENNFNLKGIKNKWESEFFINNKAPGNKLFNVSVPMKIIEFEAIQLKENFLQCKKIDEYVLYNIAKFNHISLKQDKDIIVKKIFEIFLLNL